MSLEDDLAEPRPFLGCPIPDILAQLSDRDAAALKRALVPNGRDSEYIRSALMRNVPDLRISKDRIHSHKYGRCSCRSSGT